MPVNPVTLSEALPFLVITVGFEKPFVLAKAVFSNPSIAPAGTMEGALTRGGSDYFSTRPSVAPRTQRWNGNLLDNGLGASTPARVGVRWAPPLPAADIVVQAVERHGQTIVRDYAIEVAVLVAGAFSGVTGLREFCGLAALILVSDCCFLFGFYVSILTVMVEVRFLLVYLMQELNTVIDTSNSNHERSQKSRLFG